MKGVHARRRPSVMLVGTLYPETGGITNVLSAHLQGLRARGFTVVTVNTGEIQRARPSTVSLSNARAAVSDARRVFRDVRTKRPDLVSIHTTGLPLLPVLRAGALATGALAAGGHLVIHLHSEIAGLVDRGPLRFALRCLLGRARLIVVLSENEKAAVEAISSRSRVCVVPNGVDVKVLRPPVRSDEIRLPRIVYVGAIARRKGLFDLIDALKNIAAPFQLDVVGGTGPEGKAVGRLFEEAVAGSGFSDRVVLHGECDPGQVRAVLQQGSVFVLPSHMEGLSLALLEAMACGLPAIVTDVGSSGDVVRESACGLVVPPRDVHRLSAALQLLLEDPARRVQMGAAGRRAVVESYDIDASLDDLAVLYRDTIPQRS